MSLYQLHKAIYTYLNTPDADRPVPEPFGDPLRDAVQDAGGRQAVHLAEPLGHLWCLRPAVPDRRGYQRRRHDYRLRWR